MSQAMTVGERDSGWAGPSEGFHLFCQPETASAIAGTAFENFRKFSRGGLEIGGLLLGKRTPSGSTVDQWLPIVCEHAQGPSFLLSPADEEGLKASLAEVSRSGGEVVGWFVSHSRSALELTASDLDLHKRFFKEPWQIALVVKPASDLSVRGRLFTLDGSAGPEFQFGSFAAPTVLPARPVRVVKEPPPAPVIETVTPVRKPRFVSAAVAILLTIGAGAVASVRWQATNGSSLDLRVIDTGAELRVEWSTVSPLLLDAQHATIAVQDGGRSSNFLLNPAHLRAGRFHFVRQSDDVEFRVTMHRADQPPVEEWTRFIAPSADPPAAPDDRRLLELEAENKRLRADLSDETTRRVQYEQMVRSLRRRLQ